MGRLKGWRGTKINTDKLITIQPKGNSRSVGLVIAMEIQKYTGGHARDAIVKDYGSVVS